MENQEDVLTDHVNQLREIEKEGYALGVKRGRNVLFWIAVITLVGQTLIAYARESLNVRAIAVILLLSALFAGLGLFSYRKPFSALLAGMILYVCLWVLDIIYSVRGDALSVGVGSIVVRIAFLVFLGRALPDALKLERMQREDLPA